QLYKIRNRALIQELISYGPEVNTDRVSALAQVMLYREHFFILYGGAPQTDAKQKNAPSADPFFSKDWDKYKARFGNGYKPTYDL
ncbi:MAG: hypothetical protein II661_06165, partial [Bacteroidales bacterium]|nr:hypothetical protein [Bacteroidales bacterium]